MGLIPGGIATALALYGASSWLFFFGHARPRRLRAARGLAALGFAVQGAVLAGVAHEGSFSVRAAALFTTWLIVGSYLALTRRPDRQGMGLFFLPLSFFFLLPSLWRPSVAAAAPMGLLLWLHVAATVAGAAALAVAGCTALMYLVSEGRLRARMPLGVARRLPPLSDLEDIAYRMTRYGYPLVTVGILAGAVYAHSLFGRFFVGSVKEELALLLWVCTTGALWVQGTPSRRLSLYLVVVSLFLATAEVWGPDLVSAFSGAFG